MCCAQTSMMVGRWVLVEGVGASPHPAVVEAVVAYGKHLEDAATVRVEASPVHADFLLLLTCRDSSVQFPAEVTPPIPLS